MCGYAVEDASVLIADRYLQSDAGHNMLLVVSHVHSIATTRLAVCLTRSYILVATSRGCKGNVLGGSDLMALQMHVDHSRMHDCGACNHCLTFFLMTVGTIVWGPVMDFRPLLCAHRLVGSNPQLASLLSSLLSQRPVFHPVMLQISCIGHVIVVSSSAVSVKCCTGIASTSRTLRRQGLIVILCCAGTTLTSVPSCTTTPPSSWTLRP